MTLKQCSFISNFQCLCYGKDLLLMMDCIFIKFNTDNIDFGHNNLLDLQYMSSYYKGPKFFNETLMFLVCIFTCLLRFWDHFLFNIQEKKNRKPRRAPPSYLLSRLHPQFCEFSESLNTHFNVQLLLTVLNYYIFTLMNIKFLFCVNPNTNNSMQ